MPPDPEKFPDFLHDLGRTLLDSMDQNKDFHRIIVSEFRLLEGYFRAGGYHTPAG